MSQSSSKQSSVIATMILPALAVIVVYGMWIALQSPPGSAEVVQAEQELASLQGSKTTMERVASLKSQVADVESRLAEMRQRLAADQFRAGQFSGKTVANAEQLQELGTLDQVFRNQGMMLVADRTLTQRGGAQLASSLDDATRVLVDRIKSSRETEGNGKTPYVRPNLPADMAPQDYLASLNQPTRRAQDSKMQLREVEVVGAYGDMLAALDDLNECCGNSVVIGVAVKRPESRTVASNLRLWTLQLQVRPMPEDRGPQPESPEMQLASDTK